MTGRAGSPPSREDVRGRDYAASLPPTPTTEGVPHWYLVCADSEDRAHLCGPFFDVRHAEDELREVERRILDGEQDMCERKHFLTPGPAPIGRFRVASPLVYTEFNRDARDWWEEWAYSPAGEWYLARTKERTHA